MNGKVIFYADKITKSMQRTIDETDRKRIKQMAYNEEHGITPTQIKRDRGDVMAYALGVPIMDWQTLQAQFAAGQIGMYTSGQDVYTSLVQAHASYLGQNRNRKVRLEGHADERGSREYNMALGQRRADAVRKATAVLGVGGERIETISFGEDKPKSSGHDEAAWAQNRRVEILYDGE